MYLNVPKEKWTVKAGAFSAVIDAQTFDAAQCVLRDRTKNKSDEELLRSLKGLAEECRRDFLSTSSMLHDRSHRRPRTSIDSVVFRQAYALIGYEEFRNMRGALTMRSRHNKVKETLLRRIFSNISGTR